MQPNNRPPAYRNRLKVAQIRQKLRPRSFARYFAVGVVNTAVSLCVFPILFWSLAKGWNVNFLIVLSWALCATFSFISHKYVTFESSGPKHREGLKFIILSLVILGINLIILNAAMRVFDANPVWTQVILNLVISFGLMMLNYFGLDRLVFKESNKSLPPKRERN